MAGIRMNDIFTYHDAFANSGIEFILLAIVLVAMVGFWCFLTMDAER